MFTTKRNAEDLYYETKQEYQFDMPKKLQNSRVVLGIEKAQSDFTFS